MTSEEYNPEAEEYLLNMREAIAHELDEWILNFRESGFNVAGFEMAIFLEGKTTGDLSSDKIHYIMANDAGGILFKRIARSISENPDRAFKAVQFLETGEFEDEHGQKE
jgi:hypothetical protein